MCEEVVNCGIRHIEGAIFADKLIAYILANFPRRTTPLYCAHKGIIGGCDIVEIIRPRLDVRIAHSQCVLVGKAVYGLTLNKTLGLHRSAINNPITKAINMYDAILGNQIKVRHIISAINLEGQFTYCIKARNYLKCGARYDYVKLIKIRIAQHHFGNFVTVKLIE